MEMIELLQEIKNIQDRYVNEFAQETPLIKNICSDISKVVLTSEIDVAD